MAQDEIPPKQSLDVEYKQILEESLLLTQKAYEETRASIESLNTRSGIALALVGTAVSAAGFEVWNFYRPSYSEDWPKWLVLDILNMASLGMFLAGAATISAGLFARARTTPYAIKSLNDQAVEEGKVDIYAHLELFYREQIANTVDTLKELKPVLKRKGDCFNYGLTLSLVSLVLVIFSKLLA